MFSIRESKCNRTGDRLLLLAAGLALFIGFATFIQIQNGLWTSPAVNAMAATDYELSDWEPTNDPETVCVQKNAVKTVAKQSLSGKWKDAEDQLGGNVMYFLEQECAKNHVSVALALGVIDAESNFDATIISPTRDYGLMQINAGPNNRYHNYYRELLDVDDFLNPYDNIRVGVYLLGENLRKSDGNVQLSLLSYHLGNGAAHSRWSEGVRTTAATRKQLSRYYQYLSEQPE